ncbi:unnamed protein product [Ilex paraguariensis]|uniref:Uncharacterized protein n=1 Tax=Ilex paraguariensis TaxID=185542 RepID=A0ABC8TRU6_9AQUA
MLSPSPSSFLTFTLNAGKLSAILSPSVRTTTFPSSRLETSLKIAPPSSTVAGLVICSTDREYGNHIRTPFFVKPPGETWRREAIDI